MTTPPPEPAENHARTAPLLGYATLVAACVAAFRVLIQWMTYRYFWLNAWDEVLVFAVILGVHLITRPRDDPRFRTVARRIVVATVILMVALLAFAFTIRIG